MNRIILQFIAILLNGCCYNQYERKGYSVGLDCVTPSDRTVKVCDPDKPDNSCDEKVQRVKESIKAQIRN